MHYIDRLITKKLMRMVDYFPSVVVVGARQVGKSTMLKHLFPNYSYVLFDPFVDVQNARADPDLFLDNQRLPIILDEVQYAPEVVSAVKRRIDRDKKPGQYLLTGSQQWGVIYRNNLKNREFGKEGAQNFESERATIAERQGASEIRNYEAYPTSPKTDSSCCFGIKQMTESLTGRTAILQLEPFSLSEIASNRPQESWLEQWLKNPEMPLGSETSYLELPRRTYEQLWRGFLPDAQTIPLDLIESFHASYQKTYIERDIRLLADIPDLHQFTRFVRLAAAMSAQEINYQEIGRELGIANQTAKRWLILLKEIFEWYEIPAFSMNTIKRISSKPKGYFSDTGQVCYCQAISHPEAIAQSPLWGALFETAVVNEIRKLLLWTGLPFNLYHWRSHGGAECDLIIERDGVYFPIEVKGKTMPTRGDTTGISAFRKTYPQLKIADGLVICLAESAYKLSERDFAVPWNVRSLTL